MSYLSPGVYIEEVPSAVRPIAGVSTSTAAFVSIIPDTVQLVAKGDTTPTKLVDFTLGSTADVPKLLTSWSDFTAIRCFAGFATETCGAEVCMRSYRSRNLSPV